MTGPRSTASSGRLGDTAMVAAGGMAGTFLRGALLLAVPAAPGGLPWGTLAENVAGALLLGLLAGALLRSGPESRRLQLLLATGFLGSFTTFSALALDGLHLGSAGGTGSLALYLGGSMVGGAGAAALGLALGRRLPTRRYPS